MKNVLIFAGTTEGRLLAEQLTDAGIPSTVCVATDYGESMIEPGEGLTVHTGRLNREAIADLMRGDEKSSETPAVRDASGAPADRDPSGVPAYTVVVDATHPFATVASKEIRSAAEDVGIPYLRLARATGDEALRALMECPSGGVTGVIVDTVEEAASYLDGTEGPILLTTGSKELKALSAGIRDKERLFARVLPLADSLGQCLEAGLKGRQIIAMQGPFSEDLNVAMIRQIGAKWLLTKQTGRIGGFEEKIRAAQTAGANVVVIRNPETDATGKMSYEEVTSRLEILLDVRLAALENEDPVPGSTAAPETGSISKADSGSVSTAGSGSAAAGEPSAPTDMALVGIGVGDPDYMTEAVRKAVKEAEIIFGAPRILDSLKETQAAGKVFIPYYQADKILEYLAGHPEYHRVAVAFSGDTGFYSGASSMMRAVRAAGSAWSVRILCGISAPVYFASKIGEPWQDMTLLSAHGRDLNVLGEVRRNRKSFLLCSGLESVKEIGRDLCAEQTGLKDLSVTYGYQLSYPEERIERVRPKELEDLTEDGLYVLLIENPHADNWPVAPGIPDEAFLRDKVPMTKEEIRALSLCKLRPGRKAVIYDIGAGSGSVSVEAALLCPEGWVYAVEQKDTAAALLEKNKKHFAVSNMTIIKASAPEGLEDLPAPTHVFVGGSSGNLREILEAVLAKNPSVRLVINAVTLETLAETQKVLADLNVGPAEYTLVQVSRAEELGRYHLMKAQNPVYIISAGGNGPVF